jgi:hypothetical protein
MRFPRLVTIDDCAKYLGQATQYGVGRGSQLSVLVILDHSRKEAPPGVIDNYVGWLIPRLHPASPMGRPWAGPAHPSALLVLAGLSSKVLDRALPPPDGNGRRGARFRWDESSAAT